MDLTQLQPEGRERRRLYAHAAGQRRDLLGADVAEEAQRHVEGLRTHPAHIVGTRAAQPLEQVSRLGARRTVEIHSDESPDCSTTLGFASLRGLRPCGPTTHFPDPGAELPPRARSSVGPSSSTPSAARRTQSMAA